MECVALRDRPNPVLISDSPAGTMGTRKMDKMQRAVVDGERTEFTIIFLPAQPDGPGQQKRARVFLPRNLRP
jgi:hypothetical protein